MARTTKTTPQEERQGITQQGWTYSSESLEQIIDDILALPLEAQLGILRTLGPKALARMEADQRDSFLRDFQKELELAVRGEPSYDARPDVPSMQ